MGSVISLIERLRLIGGTIFPGDRPAIGRLALRRRWQLRLAERGVNFVGPVEFVNGLGVSARGYVEGLLHADIPVNVLPWRRGFQRLQSIRVQYPSVERQSITIVHLNLDLLLADRLLEVEPLRTLVGPKCYNIAIFYWELASLLPEWSPLLERFDEIWCASSFMADAARKAGSRPVSIVRPALGAAQVAQSVQVAKTCTKADFGLPDGRFVFFYSVDVGSILGRKNPQALLQAYINEFHEDEGTCCLIKIHYGTPNHPIVNEIRALAAHRSDVILMEKLLEDEDLSQLYRAIDCYVSPHRSEGLGLTILEAMSAKKPVIVTPYGGVTDFADGDTALLLNYRLTDVGANNLPYPANSRWADPDPASLRSAMRRIFQDRSLAQRLGENGSRRVEELFSLASASRTMKAAIQNMLGNPP